MMMMRLAALTVSCLSALVADGRPTQTACGAIDPNGRPTAANGRPALSMASVNPTTTCVPPPPPYSLGARHEPSESDAHQRVRGLLEHLKEHDRYGGSNLAALALAQVSTWWWTNNTHAGQHKLIHLCNEYALEVGGKASDHLAPQGTTRRRPHRLGPCPSRPFAPLAPPSLRGRQWPTRLLFLLRIGAASLRGLTAGEVVLLESDVDVRDVGEMLTRAPTAAMARARWR